MKEIPLTQGKVALIVDEDFEALAKHKWFAKRDRHTFYAARKISQPDGKQTMEHMHRVVLARKLGRPIARGMKTDHENGNGLDNQSDNLREATSAQNHRNLYWRKVNPASRYLGLTWRKARETWRARIQVSGKSICLGYHLTELRAALAREAYITAHPELYAKSNFAECPQP